MVLKPRPDRGDAPSSTSLLFDRMAEEERPRSHEERIEQLVAAALTEAGTRLRLTGELARGGMGAVQEAFDATLQRRIAVKTMHAATYEHVMLVHGFLREAQVTGQLDHPNIVPIHELGRDAKGELYFTMKLVEGQSLKALIGGAPAGDMDRLLNLLEIFVKICDALAFAHARGVLHCDIKSANVMVGEFGQVYLMDWGGAQLLPAPPGVDTSKWVRDSLPPLPAADTHGLVFGTPSYMSPEQASAGTEPMDERSDIFSMGALLYEIMTGRAPYQGSTPLQGVLLARMCEIKAPDELAGVEANVFPPELVRIVMRALARRPKDRFQSVAEMKQAILRLTRGGGNFATVRFARGAHVIREGEVGDAAYIVVSGTLEVYKVIAGERVSLRVLGPGEMFGETAIFAASRRTASVVVVEDASMVVVTSEVIERELDSMKHWMGAFIRTLATRFGGLEEEQRARGQATGTVRAPRAEPVRAVFQDRSDITRVAELGRVEMPGPQREAPRTAAGTIGAPVAGESVFIDLSEVDAPDEAVEPADAAMTALLEPERPRRPRS